MKKWMCVAVATLCASAAVAEERHFVCISDLDGSEVRLNSAPVGDTGSIETKDVSGDAIVLNGLGNMTFVHIEDQDVMTFVVHIEDMTYNLSIKGPHAGTDRGKCTEVDA